MSKEVSVIIPCYNQGNFLKDALKSLDDCEWELFEVIIVNDGSTDLETLEYFNSISPSKYRVIHQENGGLSAARNSGIRESKGIYVLMLDADNKIRPSFITKGVEQFKKDESISVVYGNCQYFGDLTGVRKQGSFNLQKQLLVNYIDACAMIKKSVFSQVGYYDEKMREGWEDWEFWLRMAFKEHKFYYIDEVIFDYRVRNNSMSKAVYNNKAKTNRIENYVTAKYPDKMGIEHVTDFTIDRFKRNPVGFLLKLFLRAYNSNYYYRLLKENKIRNGL